MPALLAPRALRAEEAPAPPDETQPIVREIEIRGNLRVDTGTVLRLIRTRIGRPFDRKTWDEDWHRLTDSGYFLNVRTTPPIQVPGGVMLVLDLVELATISRITFKGNKSISATDLRNAIKSIEGGRYQRGQVHLDARAIEKLYHDRAFRDATCTFEIEVLTKHKQLVAGREQDVEDEVAVNFKIDEGNPVGVRSISFVGNKAVEEDELLAAISTKSRRFFRSGDLKDADLDTDKKRLEYAYLRKGYMEASVEEPDVKISKETYWNWFRKRKRLADITFKIHEGPQYHVGNLVVTGNQSIELSEIQSVMKLKPGAVFSDVLLEDDTQKIRDLYGEYGRVFTRVERDRKPVADPERIKKTPNIYDVELNIVEGSEVTVREVITRGNTKTRDKVLIRELELFPGDRADTSRIKLAKERLKNLNYFEDDIRITTEPTEDPEQADIIIDVTEKATGEFNFGVGVSSAESVLGNVSLTQRNFDYRDMPKSLRDFISGNSWVGAGQNFSINATMGSRSANYSVSFMEPWAFDRPVRLGGSIFHSRDNNFRDFNETNTGFTVSAGRRLWSPNWDGDITYRLSYTTIEGDGNTLPPIFQQQDGSRILSSITPRILYDTRDNRILPSRGMMMEASLELGGGPLLGDITWVRPTINVARHFTMYKMKNGGKHILELHAKGSLIQQYGQTDEIPPFMRYFGGGISDVRGFENRTISPIQDGFYIGGKKMITATAEYSVPLYQEIVRASVFSDVGQVWDEGKTDPGSTLVNERGWRSSVGIGLAVRTPFSPMPVRVYFSRAIQRNSEDRVKTLDFSFGTRF
ncbi:MAG: outer membrane protein assembly factor BamA [Planctomycetota bacterium]|nr:outer membrane protein assembly factor BamA [Planctomycetota bacterium]